MSPRARRDPERELAELESVFAALAHARRRHVLGVLHFRGGEMTAGQIAQRFHCTWPTMSRHLKVLEEARLVTAERRGRERVYRLEPGRLDLVRGWLAWFDVPPGGRLPQGPG